MPKAKHKERSDANRRTSPAVKRSGPYSNPSKRNTLQKNDCSSTDDDDDKTKNHSNKANDQFNDKLRRLAEQIEEDESDDQIEDADERDGFEDIPSEDGAATAAELGLDSTFRLDNLAVETPGGVASDESAVPPIERQRDLADLIFQAIEEKTRQQAEEAKLALFSPATVKMFNEVGAYMRKYKSGKLPRALRVVAQLNNWVDVLWLTHPEHWTPHAMAAATPVFITALKEHEAQKYVQYVLLPKIRDCLDKHDKLHVQLYKALQSCLFKPSSFFKGLFLPIVLDPKCNYKKVSILCSVVSKSSYPPLHTAAVLIKIAQHRPLTNQMCYVMIRLLNKKGNLPETAIRKLAQFFIEFIHHEGQLPVIWHQSLLTFVQRWKNELSTEEKEKLHGLTKIHFHTKIGPELRRELSAQKTR